MVKIDEGSAFMRACRTPAAKAGETRGRTMRKLDKDMIHSELKGEISREIKLRILSKLDACISFLRKLYCI